MVMNQGFRYGLVGVIMFSWENDLGVRMVVANDLCQKQTKPYSCWKFLQVPLDQTVPICDSSPSEAEAAAQWRLPMSGECLPSDPWPAFARAATVSGDG